MTADSAGRETTATKGWRVECRACGAWLSTHLMGDVQVWLSEHDHESPPARKTSGPLSASESYPPVDKS